MIIKIVTLFLIGMAVLAMFGRLRMPRIGTLSRVRCAACGAPTVGRGPCPCRRGKT